MFVAFFESFKYVGHLWPIALLRIYVGCFFFSAGIQKVQNHFLESPVLQESIQKWLNATQRNDQYSAFLQNWVITHWQLFSYLVVTGEIAVGVCFILGFFVRPAALVAIFMNANFLMASTADLSAINKTFIALNAALFLVAAGRCLGFDYYFYKRIRGFWW